MIILRLLAAYTFLVSTYGFVYPNSCTSCLKRGLKRGITLPHSDTSTLGISSYAKINRPAPSVQLKSTSKSINSLLNDNVPPENVLKGVEKAGYLLTAPDLAAASGCDLATASRSLVSLSALTGADLKVSEDGDITYKFPPNFREVLSRNSVKAKAMLYVSRNRSKIEHAGKVAFGVTLIASLAIVATTLIAISSSSSSDDDRRRDDRRRGGMGGMGGFGNILGPSPFDFWYYRPYRTYYVYGSPRVRGRDEMGFLESVFSYVFGDGDPNGQLEEVRVRGAARVIRESGGAVTAEQLAPFVDIGDGITGEELYVDESFVLPIVSQLGGRPEVTDDGDIVYVFEELQKTGLGKEELSKLMGVGSEEEYEEAMEARSMVKLPEEIVEVPYSFSSASDVNKVLASVFGVLNLGGVLYLGQVFSSPALQSVQLGGYIGAVKVLMPFLLTYAVAFNAIPVIRAIWNKVENKKIAKRNQTRRLWRAMLEGEGGNVRRKLRAAKKFALEIKSIGSKREIFDSGKDVLESQKDMEMQSLEQFDAKLRDEYDQV